MSCRKPGAAEFRLRKKFAESIDRSIGTCPGLSCDFDSTVEYRHCLQNSLISFLFGGLAEVSPGKMGDATDLGGLSEDDEQQGGPATDVSKPDILFDSKTMDLVVDFRAVCSLPHDPDVDGVKSLRAITFGKGKGVHAPKEPGKIYVCCPWKLLHVMGKVYFVPNTHREPELLIGFVDFGFVNPTMNGVSVETLALPLMIKKGVYQDAVRLTKIDDVAGFTPNQRGFGAMVDELEARPREASHLQSVENIHACRRQQVALLAKDGEADRVPHEIHAGGDDRCCRMLSRRSNAKILLKPRRRTLYSRRS